MFKPFQTHNTFLEGVIYVNIFKNKKGCNPMVRVADFDSVNASSILATSEIKALSSIG
jgi:hypothetical protein